MDELYPGDPNYPALLGAIPSPPTLFARGAPALAGHFPARNRTLAGLSLGVVVVEAAERSGALITAGFAGDLGREVFAVPGRITSATSAGTNRLIQDGAKLITCWQDVVSELPEPWRRMVRASSTTTQGSPRPDGQSDEGRVLAMLTPDEPQYVVSPGKKKVLDELKKAAANADTLYVATDPDREGEAIGWHLAQELDVGKNNVYRVSFNEITERAVRGAFAKPGRIDLKKVDAQQARRVLDRLVGYKLSPLLWDKVQRGLSAGRVQSVAVRLIVDREREIQEFVPVEYWSLHARLAAKLPPEFVATLKEVAGEKASLGNEQTTRELIASLDGARFVVRSVTRGERRLDLARRFITSTLQQEAGRRLGFTARKTMTIAQQLYEGIDLGSEGAEGLITYMRTDSVRVAREAQAAARGWVIARIGMEYVPEAPPTYRSRGSAQEAHEAIRPSELRNEPRSVARFLTKDQQALYRLVWERVLASPMMPAGYGTVKADIEAGRFLFPGPGAPPRVKGFTAGYVDGR